MDVGGVPHRPDLGLSLSAGRLARLAPGSVVVNAGGGATLLATATCREGPFIVDFRARAAARGVIPSTFPRRETAPAQAEILAARLVDRSLRPVLQSFHKASRNAPNSIDLLLLSADRPLSVSVDALAVNAASAAIAAATARKDSKNIPCFRPVGAARVALVDGKLVAFPSLHDISRSDISLTVAARDSRILSMGIDAVRVPFPESNLHEILQSAVEVANVMIQSQLNLVDALLDLRETEGQSHFPRDIPSPNSDYSVLNENAAKDDKDRFENRRNEIFDVASRLYEEDFVRCRKYPGKAHRAAILTSTQKNLIQKFPDIPLDQILEVGDEAARQAFRRVLVRDALRLDGRLIDEVRSIRCETNVLPGAVHGSSLFERGDTQVLACATVGLKDAAQKVADHVDTVDGLSEAKSFFLHYSFPGFATGESARSILSSASRRETGHGYLAESALRPLLGTACGESLPFVTRLSAEVLASDGSSSMASVCAGSLALMDAGIQIREPVAGVAMGLVAGDNFPLADPDNCTVLTDILGVEDFYGIMDCKVAGTCQGITSAQLDVKVEEGLPIHTVCRVFQLSKPARLEILKHMNACMGQRREELPDNAPRTLYIPVEQIVVFKELLRDRAARLKQLEAASGARIELDTLSACARIHAPNARSAELASQLVEQALTDIPVGTKLRARVVETKQGYAILESECGLLRGMLHVSKISFQGVLLSPTKQPELNSKSSEGHSDAVELEDTPTAPEKLRYRDVRHVLKCGDLLDVAVVESCRARNILRFSMISKEPFRPVEDGPDCFLEQLQSFNHELKDSKGKELFSASTSGSVGG